MLTGYFFAVTVADPAPFYVSMLSVFVVTCQSGISRGCAGVFSGDVLRGAAVFLVAARRTPPSQVMSTRWPSAQTSPASATPAERGESQAAV